MTLLKAQESRDSEIGDVQDENKYRQSGTLASEDFILSSFSFIFEKANESR